MFLYEKLNTLSSLHPDIILAYDDQALDALLTCDHPSVKTTPVVFTGVNYPNQSFIQKYPNITGFHDKPDYKTNIELIEQLIGKCIVVRVTDDIYSDKIMLDDMDQQIKDICKTNNIFSSEKYGCRGKAVSHCPKIKRSYRMPCISVRSTANRPGHY